MEFSTLEWVDWFNHRRLTESIGNIPPAEAEERYYAVLDEPAMAHNLNQMAPANPVQFSEPAVFYRADSNHHQLFEKLHAIG